MKPRPSIPARARARYGMGAVIVVAGLFIFVLACMQIAQSFLLSQVSDQTTRSSVGRICGLHAESAIEEARAVLARRANTPGDVLFSKFRQGGGTGGGPPRAIDTVTLSLSELPHLSAMLGTEQGKGLEMAGGVACSISYANSTSVLMPAEYDGVVRYKAAVRYKSEKSIVREIEETQGFRVTQLALPSPLGRYPLVIVNPEKVVRGIPGAPGPPVKYVIDVNDLCQKIAGPWVGGVKNEYNDLQRKFRDKGRDVPFIRRVEPLYHRMESDSGLNHFQEIERLKGAITPFPPIDPSRPYSLLCVTAGADLAQLNLQKQLRTLAQAFETIQGKIDQLGPKVKAQFQNNDQSEAAYQDNVQLSDMMLDSMKLALQMLRDVSYFQQCVKPVEKGVNAAAYDHLRSICGLLDPWQLADPFNTFATRAYYRIDEHATKSAPTYRSVQQQWELLKERLAAEPGFFGTVYVDNTEEPLTLTGTVRGTLVIAVRGPVLIDGLKPRDDRDLLTVVAYGGPGDQVGVRGQVKASIVTRGKALAIEPAAQIQGTVVVDEIAPEKLDVFTGTVTLDPRLSDNTFKEAYFYVGFSPWVRSRATTRS